jgi:hypothetical protein
MRQPVSGCEGGARAAASREVEGASLPIGRSSFCAVGDRPDPRVRQPTGTPALALYMKQAILTSKPYIRPCRTVGGSVL